MKADKAVFKKDILGGARNRLYFLFVIVAILSFFIIGALAFIRTKNVLRDIINERLAQYVQDIEGQINVFMDSKKGRALDFCSDGIIKDGLTYYDPDDEGVNKLIRQINFHLSRNKLPLDNQMEDILVLNLKGRVIFSSNDKWLGQDKSGKEYFLRISRHFKDDAVLAKLKKFPDAVVYTGDIYISDDLDAPALAVSNIVTARATGLPLGVLVNRYRAEVFAKHLSRQENNIGKTGKFYLLNKDGFLLNAPRFFDPGKGEVILREKIDAHPVIVDSAGVFSSLGFYQDFRGVRVMGVAAITEEKDWLIVAENDVREIFSPIYMLTGQITIVGVVSLLLFLGIIFFIISLQKKIEEKNAQADEARNQMYQSVKMSAVGQMSSSVAHEINNPLTGVLNNVQLLKMQMDSSGGLNLQDIRQTLDVIEDSASRCVKISRSLLDFSRAAQGKFSPLSINEVADKVILLVANEMRLQNITIESILHPDIPRVAGDFQLFQQAVFDIINNARYAVRKKFPKEGGLIGIRTAYEPQKNSALMLISDNGTGIPKENLEKLFTPFFTTKPQGEGTGLGLSFIHDIIIKHKGTIEVESEAGKGTTFKISLPVLNEEEAKR